MDKRIDAVATAIKSDWTVYDLADMEYAYAPPFNGPKDPLNMIGYVAANRDDGLLVEATFEELPELVKGGAVMVDVRYPWEFEQVSIPGSINIPLDQIVARHEEIPKDKPVVLVCVVGQRAYSGQCMLRHYGFTETYTLEGGVSSYTMFYPKCSRSKGMTESAFMDRVGELRFMLPGKSAVAAVNLETGDAFSWNGDEIFPSASIIKLPILCTAYAMAESGELSLTDRIEVTDAAKTLGDGVVRFMQPGLCPTLHDLMTLMIVLSDNMATNMVVDAVTPQRIGRFSKAEVLPAFGGAAK